MIKTVFIAVAAAVLVAPSANADTQLVGMSGLSANARALEQYVASTYAPPSIGGWRPCDWIGEHCSGRALDFMVYGNTSLGNAIFGDLNSNKGAHSIKYCLWQVRDHYDHVHCTVY
jgi:hypothetical protein